MMAAVTGCAALAIGLMFLIVGYVAVKGISYLNPEFITSDPVALGQEGGGIRHAIVGTLILVSIAAMIAVPLGIACGAFLSEYGGPRRRLALRFLADTLTGVPSVVVGVFVYSLIVVHTGFSALSGGIALAVIMLPLVARTSEEALYLVPRDQREAAMALGTPKWRVVSQIAIPGAARSDRHGLSAGDSAGGGRDCASALHGVRQQLLTLQTSTIPSRRCRSCILRYALSPYEVLHNQAWATAFILVAMMLVLSAVTRWVVSRSVR